MNEKINWKLLNQWTNEWISLTDPDPFGLDAATYAKYCITFFVFSVLPAPDSPVHRIDWSSRSTNRKQWQKERGVVSRIEKKSEKLELIYEMKWNKYM